jgi:hypothetical protein
MPKPKDLPGALAELYGVEFPDHYKMLLTTTDHALLGVLDKQRKYVLSLALTPLQCPACHVLICQYSATEGRFDTDASHPDDGYRCPACGAGLTWHLALIGGSQSFTLTPGQTVTVTRGPCICKGRSGHADPACPWYGTDGGA